jgi:excisionase family DNA binding protein
MAIGALAAITFRRSKVELQPCHMSTVGLQEACELLRVSPSTLMRRARAGIVPGARIGRQWVFVRDDLLQLVRETARKPRCSIDVAALRSGGSVSSSTDLNTASQLAHAIAQKRKNSRPRLEVVHGGKRASGNG